ncbi:MAG: hypothetical protein HND52_10065 [Ignavibacteriae bacterium]|nr:hypothetical protein [Ignavibacteriota bacterium]NOG98293.1 hypothetical protein [Ignavibacteriota bacterium]
MYSFDRLKNHIEETLQIDSSNVISHFTPIREKFKTVRELEGKVNLGEASFIYTDEKGKKHKGFLFIEGGYDRQTAIARGYQTIVPKFHILNCSTINQQKKRKNFDGHYVFSQRVETIKDLDDVVKEISLCRNCLNAQTIVTKVMYVSEYIEEYIKSQLEVGQFDDVDLPKGNVFNDTGYTPDWDEKSHAYRIKMKFMCQNCGIKLNKNYSDGYFLETHHLDGNKSNNEEHNLKALCVLCHSKINEMHKRNYRKEPNLTKLKTFIEMFRYNLEEVKNPFLTDV